MTQQNDTDPKLDQIQEEVSSIIEPIVIGLIHSAKEAGLVRSDFNYMKALAIGEVKKLFDGVRVAIQQDPERFKIKELREASSTGLKECFKVAREQFDAEGVNESPNGKDAGEATLARDKRVVPIEKQFIGAVLQENILFGGTKYATEASRQMLEYVFRMMINNYFDMVIEKTIMSLEMSMEIALEKLWGKPIEAVTLEDIDDVLKRVPVPTEE